MSDRPIGRPSDPGLSNLYDAIQGRNREVLPETAPKLRAIALGTLKELRRTRGDRNGNRGPACVMLAGYIDPRDGGEGVFLWDNTSITPDNGGQGSAGVVQVAGVDTGRWIRAQLYPTPVPQVVVPSRVLISHQTVAPGSWIPVAVTGDASDTLGFEIEGRVDALSTLRFRFLGSSATYDYTDVHQNAGATTLTPQPTSGDTGVSFKADANFTIKIPISHSTITVRRFFADSAEFDATGGPGASARDICHRINGRCTTAGQITSIEVAVTAGSPTAGDLYVYKTMRTPQ